MGVDAEELIIRPFREVVERGSEAVANSLEAQSHGDADRLAKAGHALVREGERALKRLQPVWDGQVEKYGDAFKDAMLQQENVEKKRLQLEDLLYDFEDYMELDSFDADKFAAVQAATRAFALDAINHTKRLKLETPSRDSTASPRAQTFPPLPPLPVLPPMPPMPPLPPIPLDRHRFSATSTPSLGSTPNRRDSLSGLGLVRRRNTQSSTATSSSHFVDRLDSFSESESARPDENPSHERRPSSPTTTTTAALLPLGTLESNQDRTGYAPSLHSSSDAVRIVASRPTVIDVTSHPTPSRLASPPLPPSYLLSPQTSSTAAAAPRTSAWVRSHQVSSAAAVHRGARMALRHQPSREGYSSGDSPVLLTRLHSLAVDDGSVSSSAAPSVFDHHPGSPGGMTDSHTSYFSSAADSCTSGSPAIGSSPSMPDISDLPPAADYRGQRHTHRRVSHLPPVVLPSPVVSPSLPAMPSLPSLPSSSIQHGQQDQQEQQEYEHQMLQTDQKEIETPMPPSPQPPPLSLPPASLSSDQLYDNGLIPAERTESASTKDLPIVRGYVRDADCHIGPKSSFRLMGGFCSGAEAFRVGGHWKGIKQTGGYVANKQTTIGRCVGCGYGHNYEEVRLDVDKKPEATFSKAAGVQFRLRLLYKSHVSNTSSSQRQAESHYACLFCIHAGQTVREGDATVFLSPDHLLLHLARHPQPLPPVPGVTVVYGELDPADMRAHDFDLHLEQPPLPMPMPPSVTQTAVATALREHVQRYGAKKLARPPGYAGDMLPFLEGARVVGLMFPERWEGKWCMGWHDGLAGAFPAKAVQFEPPQENEIPMASSSGMSVKARWKWHPEKDREKDRGKRDAGRGEETAWLEFDKGETISNVKCLYADHWCWSGTNSKGRYGVFPQSHILTQTLQQEPLRAVAELDAEAVGGGDEAVSQRPRTGWSKGRRGLFGKSSGSRRPMSSSGASTRSSSTGQTRLT